VPFLRGENWGICNARYTPIAFDMVVKLTNNLLQYDGASPVTQAANSEVSYYSKPGIEDLLIRWDSYTAESIENLVNAANPSAGGAVTLLKQQLVNILEVSPVDGLGSDGIKGGTVIHADGTGLYVQCFDKGILRINILKMNEGFLTGFKLAALGVRRGDLFETPDNARQMVVN